MNQGEILKNLRIESGLKQKDLAKLLGIGQSTIVGYERGLHEATADILSRYATFFEVSTDYLLGREDDFGNVTVQSPARSPIGEKLTDNERTLLNWYRGLPSEKARAAFLSFISSSGEMFAAKRN